MSAPVDVSFCNIPELTRRCEVAWGREVDPYAAAYLARLLVRRMTQFEQYLPRHGGRVTANHMYHAASCIFD